MNDVRKAHKRTSHRIKKVVQFVGLTLVCMIGMFTNIQAKINIPQPTEQFYVADYANVLTQETRDHIVMRNDELFAQTGAQIIVATIDFLDGYEIEDYAYAMFNEWKIGDKEKQNGVLLLLVIGEENYWVMQGKGLESTLSSSVLKNILMDDMEPYFAVGDYNTGVYQTFESIHKALEGNYGSIVDTPNSNNQGSTNSNSEGNAFVIVGGILLELFGYFFFILIILMVFRPRRFGRRRSLFTPLFMPRPRYYRDTSRRYHQHNRSNFGGFGGGSFGGGRSSGSRPSGGSRMGGGGSSRGGGAGRH